MLEPWGRGERRVISVTEKGREERKPQGDTAKTDKWRDRGRIKGTEGEEARRKGRKKGSCRKDQTGGAGAENG